MKHSYKIFGAMLLSAAVFTSCADMDPLEFNFEKPASIEGMEYLADYGALKEYSAGNPNISSNFKLGAALAATDYNANGVVTRLANANFDEIVAGNEMKMASIVNDKGDMDFSTVEAFVRNANENGISIYGHTLAWHSQQPVKWLNAMLADKPIEINPDDLVEKEDYTIDYTKIASFPFYPMGYSPDFSPEEGLISLSDAGWYQYFAADNMGLEAEKKYKVSVTYKSPVDASITVVLRWGWGGDQSFEKKLALSTTDEWSEASVQFDEPLGGANGFIVFQLSGVENQRICFKDLTVSHSDAAGPATYMESLIDNVDMEGDDAHNFFVKENSGSTINRISAGAGVNGGRGARIESKGSQADAWESQFWIASNKDINAGDKIHLKFDYRADGGCAGTSVSIQTHMGPGDYIYWQSGYPDVSFSSDWQTYDKTITIDEGACRGGIMQSLAFNMSPNATDGVYYIDNVVLEIEKQGNGIPLTPEEKKDTLTWAMDKWISGMMEACEGNVHAWDVVNEALSGGNPDGDGVYALQHATESSVNNFFWQDYMGDLDYVRTAVRLARQYGPEDIKLFVNDYNLESDWDKNGKLKSLIEWIKRWESDGVTKIDGIGTQMHISCYANKGTQESKKNAIENMFKLMAATGKLVRVSELDMGYVDESGTSLKTEDLTQAQHREMSDLYKWIIKKYVEIVPANQQYGITQWCITDAPASSSWRTGEPVGLWDLNYNRKHTYAGFADGLGGK